jgi:hypothetical protein
MSGCLPRFIKKICFNYAYSSAEHCHAKFIQLSVFSNKKLIFQKEKIYIRRNCPNPRYARTNDQPANKAEHFQDKK